MSDWAQARFYGILDTGYVPPSQWEAKAKALIEGGAGLVEFRAKDCAQSLRIELLDTIVPLFAAAGVPLIVNDHLDLALRHPGLGLHLGQDDMPPREARKALGPDRILGLSTHSLEQAQNAIALPDVLSYFAVGPVFATATKPTYAPVGLELVQQVASLQPPLPFFAIGGINRQTVQAVKHAGAERVVVVSDALCAEDTAGVVREIRGVLEN